MSEQPPPPPPGDPGDTGGGTPPPMPPPPGPPSPYGPGQAPPYGGGYAPPPPGGGYAPPGEQPYNAPDAFGYGWNKFKAKPSEMLVPILVVFLVVVVVQAVAQFLLRATLLDTGLFVALLGAAIAAFVSTLITQVLGAGLFKNALYVADGQPATIDAVFAWAVKPEVIGTAALVAVITAVGTILCYVPGLIAGFLLNWAMFFVVDKNLSPVEAIKASVSFTTGNLGPTLVFYLLGVVALFVGAVLCLVGLLVAVPVVLIGAAYTFRRLQGEPVTPAP